MPLYNEDFLRALTLPTGQAVRTYGGLQVTAEAEAFEKQDVFVGPGVTGEKVAILSQRDAKARRGAGVVRYVFDISANRLVRDEKGWQDLIIPNCSWSI